MHGNSSSTSNDPFPDLDLVAFERKATKWAARHPLIRQITLCEAEEDDVTRYVLAVEVAGYQEFPRLLKEDEPRRKRIHRVREGNEKIREANKKRPEKPLPFKPEPNIPLHPEFEELLDVVERWQPDNLPELAGAGLEELYQTGALEKIRERERGETGDRGKWDIRYQWLIELYSPGEELTGVLKDRKWVLYRKEEHVQSKNKRPSSNDKTALQDWCKQTFGAEKWPGPTAIALQAKQIPQWSMYEVRTMAEKWIRPIHPNYTPGQPGCQKKRSTV
jgi:hypothetical protein